MMKKFVLSFIILSLPLAAFADGDLSSVWTNRKGSEALQSQNYVGAYETFVKGLAHSPFQAEFHLNLGLAFEGRNEGEKAIQSYLSAEKLTSDPTLRFLALYNAAQAYGKAKKVDEALDYYQKALELHPHSKEVKTNIELLVQSQQGGGGGSGENKEQKDNQDQKDQEQKEQQDNQDEKDPKDKPKDYKNPKQQQGQKKLPQDLSENDVRKIFEELKQQEQKIRAEYEKKEGKEQPRDKDW